MQIELRQIQRTLGTTTILVTHDQAEAMALSDRVVVMNAGRVEQIATPQQAYERPASPFVARFLGRTNELEGRVSLGVVKIGSGSWCKPTAQAGDAMLVVRPEKIALVSPAPDRLNGIVRMRVFQGNHWLYRIETPAGAVLAIRQNSGEPGPAEGDAVGLSWSTDDMVVRPRSEAPS
jgi:putative spermidine/putrescine transport system ATP-binding protein